MRIGFLLTNPDFFMAIEQVPVSGDADEQTVPYNPEEAKAALEDLLPKVKSLSEKKLEDITPSELYPLIDESSKIELNDHNQEIFNTLVDLGRALFKEIKPKETPEYLLKRLGELV